MSQISASFDEEIWDMAMADRAIISTASEVVSELSLLELDRDALIEVVRYADRERSFCTSNDIRGFDLITVNAKAARGLRETFCGERWVRDEKDNQPGIMNQALGIRIVPCNFNQFAGNERTDPKNVVVKGFASDRGARCNSTGWIPGLPAIPSQPDADIKTYVLGIHSVDDEPLRAELSMPISFKGGRYAGFSKRIILLTGTEGVGEGGARIMPERDGPVEVVDITIKRK